MINLRKYWWVIGIFIYSFLTAMGTGFMNAFGRVSETTILTQIYNQNLYTQYIISLFGFFILIFVILIWAACERAGCDESND